MEGKRDGDAMPVGVPTTVTVTRGVGVTPTPQGVVVSVPPEPLGKPVLEALALGVLAEFSLGKGEEVDSRVVEGDAEIKAEVDGVRELKGEKEIPSAVEFGDPVETSVGSEEAELEGLAPQDIDPTRVPLPPLLSDPVGEGGWDIPGERDALGELEGEGEARGDFEEEGELEGRLELEGVWEGAEPEGNTETEGDAVSRTDMG
jgi:hypothetical protein